MPPPPVPSPFGIGGRWGPQATPRGAHPNPRSRWGPPIVPRPPRHQQPGFANQQQPGFAGQQPPRQQQPGFANQQQPGFIGQTGAQGRWQAPWGGQPVMPGWGIQQQRPTQQGPMQLQPPMSQGPQGGQPPFPQGTDGSQTGQHNPLYDITGGFSKEAQRMVDHLVKEMGVDGRKSAYEAVLQPGAKKEALDEE